MNGFSAADMTTAAANGFRDGLAAQPATAQEAEAWGVYAKSDEYPDPFLIPEYAGSRSVIQSRVMEKARSEGFIGDFDQRIAELGWWLEPLFRAAPVAAAPVVDPSRLGAAMTAFDAAGGHAVRYAPEWMRKALEASSTPAAPGIGLEQFRDKAGAIVDSMDSLNHSSDCRCYQYGHPEDSCNCGLTGTRQEAKDLLALIDASPEGGSGEPKIWGTQIPGRMPKLFGARRIAELNWYPDEGYALVCMQLVERVQPTSHGAGVSDD